jgi:RimJ/RimL family protein N-acetyltransferase
LSEAAALTLLCDITRVSPDLTDGAILLRPLRAEDALDHLAGEDEQIAKWLSGGRSTLATVQNYIARCEESWRSNGPIRAFGVFDCATGRLIGSIEANLALLGPGEANVSYCVFAKWRGKGIARRALHLMGAYLRTSTAAREMVLRIACENSASMGVAENSGFQFLGFLEEAEGRMARYALTLR